MTYLRAFSLRCVVFFVYCCKLCFCDHFFLLILRMRKNPPYLPLSDLTLMV